MNLADHFGFSNPSAGFFLLGDGLVQNSQLVHGPVAEDGLAVDVATLNRADFTTVIGHGPVIAQHEVGIGRNDGLSIGTGVLIIRRNVRFRQQGAVHVNTAIDDADAVAGQADHALDEALARVPRIMKHNDVTALDAFKAVDQLVDEDALLVFKARLHAAAFYFDRLIEKYANEEQNYQSKDQVSHPRAQSAQAGRFRDRGRLGGGRLAYRRRGLWFGYFHSARSCLASIIRSLHRYAMTSAKGTRLLPHHGAKKRAGSGCPASEPLDAATDKWTGLSLTQRSLPATSILEEN